MEYVTLDKAMMIIAAASKKAVEIKTPMNIAVVDSGANVVAFVRMDGAWLGSGEIAKNKAYSARAFDMSTKQLGVIAAPGATAFGIDSSTDHRIAIFPGGIPIKVGDTVVGAVGVSGGDPNQDHAVAEAGVKAFIL